VRWWVKELRRRRPHPSRDPRAQGFEIGLGFLASCVGFLGDTACIAQLSAQHFGAVGRLAQVGLELFDAAAQLFDRGVRRGGVGLRGENLAMGAWRHGDGCGQ